MVEDQSSKTISHYVCYIPTIKISVSPNWLDRLRKTRNPENREKRAALLAAIKRWIYLSYLLESEQPKDIEKLYGRAWMWDEIGRIKKTVIPGILSPLEITFITPEYVLQTGTRLQLSPGAKSVVLNFTLEILPKPNGYLG